MPDNENVNSNCPALQISTLRYVASNQNVNYKYPYTLEKNCGNWLSEF